MRRPITASDRAPVAVVGFHGCHAEVADRLLAGEAFRVSENDYDWLGSGVYFWEYAPFRAREWAEGRFGPDARVLRANVDLGNCLNLLDTVHMDDLRRVHSEIVERYTDLGVAVPTNRGGRNTLDRLVINEFAEAIEAVGSSFDTVRGCFPEGSSLFDGSQILSRTHVQIAVRNTSCIGGLQMVNFP